MPRAKLLPIVTSDLPIGDAIGLDVSRAKCFHARCRIVAKFGDDQAELYQNFSWNGADVPALCALILGVSQYDPRLALASGVHDRGCSDPRTAQAIADANFITLLGPIIWNSKRLDGIPKWRRIGCFIGVRVWSIFGRKSTRIFFGV